MAEKNKSKLAPILIILMLALLIAAGVIIALLISGKDSGNSDDSSLNFTPGSGIGYEINASVITSGDIAFSQPEGVAVRFKPLAISNDGINFDCEIGNSLANKLDMYIDIYSDVAATDQLYISGLMRPGEGITSFKARHEMPKGNYDVVLVLTLVEDDHSTLHAQSIVALTLNVE